MALHQTPHHVGLACGAKRRADLLRLFHLNQPIDDVAALHQQAMDLRVDRVDLLAEHLKRRWGGRRLRHTRNLTIRIGDMLLGSGVFTASRRVETCVFSLMLRDGARAPPHREGAFARALRIEARVNPALALTSNPPETII